MEQPFKIEIPEIKRPEYKTPKDWDEFLKLVDEFSIYYGSKEGYKKLLEEIIKEFQEKGRGTQYRKEVIEKGVGPKNSEVQKKINAVSEEMADALGKLGIFQGEEEEIQGTRLEIVEKYLKEEVDIFQSEQPLAQNIQNIVDAKDFPKNNRLIFDIIRALAPKIEDVKTRAQADFLKQLFEPAE